MTRLPPVPPRYVVALGGFLLLGAPLAASAVGLYGETETAGEPAAATVEMTDGITFRPATVRIRVGETVTWRNTSRVSHSVTADPSLASNRSNARVPSGAGTFNAADVAPGGTYSRTFTVAGEYRYFCIPHEGQGMIGTIVVAP